MKKYLLALMTVVGFCIAAQAQRTEVFASYGGYTQMDAMDCHDGGPDVNNAWGALNLGVNVNIAPNFWIGPSYTFSSTTRKSGMTIISTIMPLCSTVDMTTIATVLSLFTARWA